MDKKTISKLIKQKIISGTDKLGIGLFLDIVNILDKKSISEDHSLYSGFEFSYIENDPKIRLLHLDFWTSDLSKEHVNNFLDNREKKILQIFKILQTDFNCAYDLGTVSRFFKFNHDYGPWPILIGLEKGAELSSKIKLYYGINGASFPFNNFCQIFGLGKSLSEKFTDTRFDTIALDFLPDNQTAIKLYPLTAKNRGFLLRIGNGLDVMSRKAWLRLPSGITVEDFGKSGFMTIPSEIKSFMAKYNLRIHYLCVEGNKKSLYFR